MTINTAANRSRALGRESLAPARAARESGTLPAPTEADARDLEAADRRITEAVVKILITYTTSEIERILEEAKGLHRRDGGPVMQAYSAARRIRDAIDAQEAR